MTQQINLNHLKDDLRHYVLEALDFVAAERLPILQDGSRCQGWKDEDLPNLFKAIDTQLEILILRYGLIEPPFDPPYKTIKP